jgi:TolB-like protein/tetratricopeptide (TPR) repeat protein
MAVPDDPSDTARDASESRAAAEVALRSALVGRYDIERELGRGGMATVYLAHDRRHGRRVAVKVLDPLLGASMSAERFLREIRLTASLTHPHVLPLHDSGEAAGQLYYVMPYVAGETLRARLAREGTLSIPDATRLLRELADALAYAHGQGVVHRDLKPENVLLADGHAVVADFGIARAVRQARESAAPGAAPNTGTLTEAGTSLGTPAYMAPEQAVGGAIDHRTDLYALGVIAYEALAGAHPFDARTAQAMVAAHIAQTPPPLPGRRRDVPPALATLVTRLLAKDSAARPASAELVLEALDAVGSSPRRGTRRVAPGVAATLLVASVVAGYAVWTGSPAPEHRGTLVAPVIGSVAVLPFVNTGGVASDDYFSDGLTDELAHALARLPGLRLAGRDGSYAFKGKHVAASEVGRVLGVDAFISATVRRSGDRVRVNPQLVSTADGTVLWDGVYESQSGDVFAVQDSLTRAVVTALAPTLGAGGARGSMANRGVRPVDVDVDVGRGTQDPEAYELYLKGMYHWHERSAGSIARAIDLFQQAIGRDPTFARAYAGLAFAYAVLGIYVPDPADSAGALLKASARRAMTLDSTLADAHHAMALALAGDSRFAEAEAEFRGALRIEPSNAVTLHGFGGMLASVGRTEEAITELRKATQLDPLAKSAGTMLAEALIDVRRFREAENEAHRILAIDSTFPLALFSLGLAQAFGGRPDSAVRTLERGVRLYPTLYSLEGRLLFAYAAAGRWDDVERMRAQLRRPGGDRSGGVLPAFADLVLGDRAPLLRLVSTPAGLRRWFNTLRMTFRAPGCNPLADPLLADAGYRAAMRNLGMAPCPQARPWPLLPRPAT